MMTGGSVRKYGVLARAGALLQYSQVLGRLKTASEWDNPSRAQTEEACRALHRDFTVGTTDEVSSSEE